MPTLKDISKLTNVSISTVSRILNHDNTLVVTEETRQNVLKAAIKISYKPNRKSSEHEQYTIAMLHWYTREQEIEDTYYLSIRLGVEKACHDLGIKVVKIFFDDPKHETTLCHGAIAIGKFDYKEITSFKLLYKHIVFIDSSPDENQFDSVVIDFETAYLNSIKYLQNLGIVDIGYIGGREYTHSLKLPIGEKRESFFRHYFKSQTKIYIGEFTIESGYNLMKKAIAEKNLAQAYLIASDAMALGALRALYEANIHVPNDVSIIGFNDIPQSAYTIPPLTTVKVFKEHMGYKAVNLLIERIKGRVIAEKVVVQTKLIIRKSTRE